MLSFLPAKRRKYAFSLSVVLLVICFTTLRTTPAYAATFDWNTWFSQTFPQFTFSQPVFPTTVQYQQPLPTATTQPTPTTKPTSTPTPTLKPTTKPLSTPTYAATQIGDHTFTITGIPKASSMPSVSEVLTALNNYRAKRGVPTLAADSNLMSYAQSRASLYKQLGRTDTHAAFLDFIQNQNGFAKLGFNALGENSSYLTYPVGAQVLIESLFGADAQHDQNQLNTKWSHVGIGIDGLGVDLVFGGSKR